MTPAVSSVQGIAVQVLPDGRMDAKNAARYCGLSEKTMAMKRCTGTGPKYVKRGRIFYHRADLDAWLSAERFGSTAQQKLAAAQGLTATS
jgi:hypothetical protein